MKLVDYISSKPVLKTEHLILREMTPEDIPALKEWMPDKSIYTYWGKGPGKTDKNPELLFEHEKLEKKSFQWGIAERTTNKVIGEMWLYLIENDRMAKVAIRLSRDVQGRGYGTEALREVVRFAFEQTELKRLWTDVDIRNTPSVRILEKSGFLREGLIRQGKAVSMWCDYYIYGMLKEDYEKSN